jgi:hypothetical protein
LHGIVPKAIRVAMGSAAARACWVQARLPDPHLFFLFVGTSSTFLDVEQPVARRRVGLVIRHKAQAYVERSCQMVKLEESVESVVATHHYSH